MATHRYLIATQLNALMLIRDLGQPQTEHERKLARIADFMVSEIERRKTGADVTPEVYERTRSHHVMSLVLSARHFKSQLATRTRGEEFTQTDRRITRVLGAAMDLLLDVIDAFGDRFHRGDNIGDGLEARLQSEFGMSEYEAVGDAAYARLLLIPIHQQGAAA